MKKKCRVILLPTNYTAGWRKGNVIKNISSELPAGRLEIAPYDSLIDLIRRPLEWQAQHLYFINDDEIKKGDWCATTNTKADSFVGKADYTAKMLRGSYWKKIVASTDSSLNLPLIPQEWVKDVYIPSNGSIKHVKLEILQECKRTKGVCDCFLSGKYDSCIDSIQDIKLTGQNEVVIVNTLKKKETALESKLKGDINVVGYCANCGVEYHIHSSF